MGLIGPAGRLARAATHQSLRLAGMTVGLTVYATEHAAGRAGRSAGAVGQAVTKQVSRLVPTAIPRLVIAGQELVTPGEAMSRMGQIFASVAGELTDAGPRRSGDGYGAGTVAPTWRFAGWRAQRPIRSAARLPRPWDC